MNQDQTAYCRFCGVKIARGPGVGRRAWRHSDTPGEGLILCDDRDAVATPR